jgi:ABC-2 type transport system ATP-binding protein
MKSTTDSTEPPSGQEKPTVVQTFDLSKVYTTGFWLNQKIASLQGCSLSVFQGETFGLLGPNGAGKTTLLKLLLGIVRPTSGRGLLLNHPLGSRSVKQRLGYLPENAYFYDYLTGWECLQMTAGLFQIPAEVQKLRIPQLLELVGLPQAAARKKQMRQYSKGMLQRVGMAQALINDPELVFLDEPMSGLDPLGRYQMRNIILSLKQQGKTIFFNSHILSEVEQICDRVAILAQGQLICSGSIDELLGTANVYHIKAKGGTADLLNQWVIDITWERDNYWHGQILTKNIDEFLTNLPALNIRVITLNLSRPSLEEFFLQQLKTAGTSERPDF